MAGPNIQIVARGRIEEGLLDAARELVPVVIAGREEAIRNADVLPETIAAIKAAGLFRVLQPKRWGGLEMDPRTMLRLQNVFSEHCMSTGWVYGVLSVQCFVLGRMGEQAQADVWGEDSDTLVSSSFQPTGKVIPVDGGYRISGRYSFSSGSSHAKWAIVGGLVPPDGARTTPEMRLFLLPKGDYRIDRMWDPMGLQATGSNDLIIDDAFVPAHRTYAPDSGYLPLQASSGVPELYRLPWLYLFSSVISCLAIGAGRGALKIFTDVTRTRQGSMGAGAARDNPKFLSVIGRARVEIDTIERQLMDNYGALVAHVEQDAPLSLEQSLLYRAELTSYARRIIALVDEMMLLLGGRGVARNGPLTQIWLDLMTQRGHAGNDPSAMQTQLAGEMLAAGD